MAKSNIFVLILIAISLHTYDATNLVRAYYFECDRGIGAIVYQNWLIKHTNFLESLLEFQDCIVSK